MNPLLIIIQVRRSSSRLKDKVLLPLCGKELFVRMIERVNSSKYGKNVVVATTKEKEDDIIEQICKREHINIYRGSTEDLLDRHFKAALYYKAEFIAKIPSDCPLIDPAIIDKVIGFFMENISNYDYVSNLHPPSYPDGNDVEIMTLKALEKAWENSEKKFMREHTTPYLWENPDKFRIGNVKWESGLDYSMTHRFTIDYIEDYFFIKKVYDLLYNKNKRFGLNDILEIIDIKYPEIKEINKKYAGVNWYRNHLKELKTVSSKWTKII